MIDKKNNDEIIKDNFKQNKDDVIPTSLLIQSCQTTVYNSCKHLNDNSKSIEIETINETDIVTKMYDYSDLINTQNNDNSKPI